MQEQIAEAVVENLKDKGFAAVEIGLAAVGVVAVGIGIYNTFAGARMVVKQARGLGEEFVAGMEDIMNDPKFKAVRKKFFKGVVDADIKEGAN